MNYEMKTTPTEGLEPTPTKKGTMKSSKESTPVRSKRPDYTLVIYDEGEPIKIGDFWSNSVTGKKAVIELDLSKFTSGKGKIRSWLCPRRAPRGSKTANKTLAPKE